MRSRPTAWLKCSKLLETVMVADAKIAVWTSGSHSVAKASPISMRSAVIDSPPARSLRLTCNEYT